MELFNNNLYSNLNIEYAGITCVDINLQIYTPRYIAVTQDNINENYNKTLAILSDTKNIKNKLLISDLKWKCHFKNYSRYVVLIIFDK